MYSCYFQQIQSKSDYLADLYIHNLKSIDVTYEELTKYRINNFTPLKLCFATVTHNLNW